MSVGTLAPVPGLYFGKIPSRGDFVRSASHTPVIKLMDRWVSQGLDALSQDVHWKSLYDQAPAVHFAFLSLGSHHGLAGHLIASADQSGRRFPLVTAGVFDVDEPWGVLRRAPIALRALWQSLAEAGQALTAVPHAQAQPLNAPTLSMAQDPAAWEATFEAFLAAHTVGSLQAVLQSVGHDIDLRLSLLGLGLLLEAIPGRGQQPIDKGLCLPLPQEPALQACVASWWLDLVTRFVRQRPDLELSVYLPQAQGAVPCPVMFVGFSGGAAAHFCALFDPRAVASAFVDTRRAGWAEAHAEQSYGARKLSGYLRQPELSLKQAHRTFCEAFLGE